MVKTKYKAVLTMNEVEHKGEGETAFDALDNLNLGWADIKTKGVLKLSKGKETSEKLFYLGPLRRVFATHLKKRLEAKYLERLLEGKPIIERLETNPKPPMNK